MEREHTGNEKGVVGMSSLIADSEWYEQYYKYLDYEQKNIFIEKMLQRMDLLTLYSQHNEQINSRPDRYNELKTMKHKFYLMTKEWKLKREILIRIFNKCQLCGKQADIYNVHHNVYENKPCENIADLLVLCEYCHHLYHNDKFFIRRIAKTMLYQLGKL